MEKLKKLYNNLTISVKEKDDDKREITAIGSQQKTDRDGDIIFLDGLNLKNFKKNPQVLWSHNSNDPPIGKATKVWVDGKDLKFKIKFIEPEISPFADTVYKMVKNKYLNSLSIGFAPDWEEAKFQDKRGGYDFIKSDLLEVSIVNVPANQGARVIERVQKAFEDGVLDEAEVKDFELTLQDQEPEDIITDLDEVEEEVLKNVIVELKEDVEDELRTTIKELEDTVAELKQQIKATSEEVEETPAVHIVDQFLDELFESEDSTESDSKESSSDEDDLENYIDEVLNDG